MNLTEPEWQALALSAQVGVWATLLCLLPGISCGWLLARKDFFAKPAFEALLFMPMVLPPTVPGYLLLVTFGSQGSVGKWLKNNFNVEFVFNWKGAVLASAIIAFPLMVQAARNFTNLFEVPTLFYMICVFALVTQNVSAGILSAAWIYVALRVAHSFIHTTNNKIILRMNIYGLSWVVLLYMGLSLGYKIFLQMA